MLLKPKHIVFDARSAIGDSVSYLPALLMLKTMFPKSYIKVIGNRFCRMMYAGLDFIDEVMYVDNYDYQGFTKALNQDVDVVILPDRSTALLKATLKSTCPTIITFSHLMSLTNWRIKCILPFDRMRSHTVLHYLKLVQRVNPELYQQKLQEIDFTRARIVCNAESQAQSEQALREMGYSDRYQNLIAINPHSVNVERKGYNLKHSDYIALGRTLAQLYPNCFFVLLSYNQGGYDFHPIDKEGNSRSNLFDLPNFKLHINGPDLMVMVGILKRCELLITPSTGNAHIADNLGISVLGAWPYYDYPRWGADASMQLAKLQGKTCEREFKYVELNKDWQQQYDVKRDALFKLCTDYMQQHFQA